MILPLMNRLRKRAQAEVAVLQDMLVEIVYGLENNAVLHGGTAVWRCYGGNRFSEDLDFYCRVSAGFEEAFRGKAAARGMSVLKFKRTGNLVFCRVSNGIAEARVEINFTAAKKPVLGRYEKADGTFMEVLTLAPGDLMEEKMQAYSGRRFIRDIYDVHHLAGLAGEGARKKLAGFLESLREPVDERNLKAFVYSGVVPSFRQIVESLRRLCT